MPDDEKAAEPSLVKAVFTGQAYPWLLLLALLAINAIVYPSMFGLMGRLWWFLGPLLSVQIWVLGALIFMHKLKDSDKYADALVYGRRLGILGLCFLYAVNCIDSLFRILILKQWKYYKRWEPLQPDQSIWFGVAYNVLGALVCGALVIWAIHAFWRSRRTK
ncbi:hypothetical protein [Bosea sp. CS1GBMeth4]|uniref:hypothetical protein n=1 Tax=Bosea sp. CS1GBMeth4 TaxID=1892849 RepID=UPI0016461929|nr:hypothetical protein [Bosea sp. CS1GBMeth4]